MLSDLTEKRNQERRYHAETQEAGRRERFNFLKTFGELLTPKGMSFGDTNTSSLFLLLPIIAF